MKNKDWVGNKAATFATLGASNHSKGEREKHDFYATEPKALELLLEKEIFSHVVWECACGMGHLSEVLRKAGHTVYSTDLIDRGYKYQDETLDFLTKKYTGGVICSIL